MQFKATLLYASLNKQSINSGVYRSMEESKRERERWFTHQIIALPWMCLLYATIQVNFAATVLCEQLFHQTMIWYIIFVQALHWKCDMHCAQWKTPQIWVAHAEWSKLTLCQWKYGEVNVHSTEKKMSMESIIICAEMCLSYGLKVYK